MKALIIQFLFFFFIASLSVVKAESCKLPRGEKITIGCTKKCNGWTKRSVRRAARRLRLNYELVDLYNDNASVDWNYIDAVIIPGGEDIAPMYYIAELPGELQDKIRSLDKYVNYTESGAKRDFFEYSLLDQYFNDDALKQTPILGICRGMQMLGVSQKIPLIVDIKKELGFRNRRWTYDRVKMQGKDSWIYSLMGNRRMSFRGWENHHQGLRLDYFRENKDLWPNLEITATSNKDRIAEVLEFKDRPVRGVQFHPEQTFSRLRRRIFKWIVKKGCENKKLKLAKELK